MHFCEVVECVPHSDANDVFSDVQFTNHPVEKQQVPNEVGRSHRHDVYEEDHVAMLLANEIVQHKRVDTVKAVDAEGHCRKVQREQYYRIEPKVVDTAALESFLERNRELQTR